MAFITGLAFGGLGIGTEQNRTNPQTIQSVAIVGVSGLTGFRGWVSGLDFGVNRVSVVVFPLGTVFRGTPSTPPILASLWSSLPNPSLPSTCREHDGGGRHPKHGSITSGGSSRCGFLIIIGVLLCVVLFFYLEGVLVLPLDVANLLWWWCTTLTASHAVSISWWGRRPSAASISCGCRQRPSPAPDAHPTERRAGRRQVSKRTHRSRVDRGNEESDGHRRVQTLYCARKA